MSFVCAFCGSTERPRGKEHVLADWLSTIGLDDSPVEYHVGRLNRVARRWTSSPFTATVGAVCDGCNHGWLSQLESDAKPILTPLIHGEAGELSPDEQRLIAVWAFKTALVAMLSSSNEERAAGYGAPAGEYTALYASRKHPEPLPYSQIWIGYYAGQRPPGTIRIVPLVTELENISGPAMPCAYLVTVVVGALLVQGVRFTTPGLYVDLATTPKLPWIWPTQLLVVWPPNSRVDDEALEPMLEGRALRVLHPGVRLVPFKPATDLEPSDIEGSKIKQPVPCGKHHTYFPAILALEAMHHSKRYALLTRCECDITYLVILEANGAHFRNDGTMEQMIEVIERLKGEEYEFIDENGYFFYKELA